jgi:mono/diheme cytochrome c family protein
MRSLSGLTGIIMLVATSTALAEVKAREVPMRWQQAAISDGGELYGELCAVCHGKSGKGDGPAAGALKKSTPDLTVLACNNGGIFPQESVEDTITGKASTQSHGTVDMPIWGAAFEGVRPDWKPFRRGALAQQRIHNLTEYLSTIQVK